MKRILADAYDTLMDRAGTAPILAILAVAAPQGVIPFETLLRAASALGGPGKTGPLRDFLMTLQPLLLRVDPGTGEELVGFRHADIAVHVWTRDLDGITRESASLALTDVATGPHRLDELWLFVDGELDGTLLDEIRDHLEECPLCLEVAAEHLALKAVIARHAAGETAPDDLRTRILAQLRQTVERRSTMDIAIESTERSH